MIDYAAFANRLRKNVRHWRKWANRHNLAAWRVYDKDLPQFPFAIDVYGEHAHVQEYDTGWQMDDADYEHWLATCVAVVADELGMAHGHIHVKKRMRQKGDSQYEKQAVDGADFVVQEGRCQFWVNLDNYLDTGLFLDHRNTRERVGQEALGKRFLNLFSYTGSFTVYAALGGASASETVDLSNTYLDWARRNLMLNGVNEKQHRLVREDVFAYLQTACDEGKQFDLVVMDPPSFSNSKKMHGILDIQRDHERLIDGAMALLSAGGVLYFSNNFRGFILSEAIVQRYDVEEISHQSVPADFRNKKIHRCWRICFQAA